MGHSFGPRRVVAAVAVGILSCVAAATADAASPAVGRAPSPFVSAASAKTRAAQGLVYRGLRRAASGRCVGGYALSGVKGYCTPGPDAAPYGVDVRWRTSRPLYRSVGPTATVSTLSPRCGTDGPRVQAVYVRASDVTDRYSTLLPTLRGYAAKADGVFSASAAATGGVRHVRYATDAACQPTVAHVVVSATGDDSFSNTIAELRADGYDRTDRKYLIWVDAGVYCGIGTVMGDDSPGATNANNRGPSYARVDRACWGGDTEAHELAHNLGAVQLSAPHSSGGWHCTDEADRMCYRDGSTVTLSILCPSAGEHLFDCRHDDYYHTDPNAGSYLDTHWNVARSVYLASS